MEWPLDGDVEETILTLAAAGASLRDCASMCGVCRRWRSLLRGGSRTVRASAYAAKPWLLAYAEGPGALHMFDPIKWQWQTAMKAGYTDRVPVRFSDGGDGALYFRWDTALLLRLNCLSSEATFRWPEAPPVPGRPQHRPLLFFSRGLGKVAVATLAYLAVLDLQTAQWSKPGLPAVLGRPSAGAVRGSLLYLFSASYSTAACLDMATGKWLFIFRLRSSGGRAGMAFIDGGRHGLLIAGLAEPVPGHENPFQKQDYLTFRVLKILVDEPRFTKEYRAGRTPTADCIELCRMPPVLSPNFFDCKNTVQCKGMHDLIYFFATNSAAAACEILENGDAVWRMLPPAPNSAKEYGCWTVNVDEIDNSEPDSMAFFRRLYPESASVFSQHSHDMGDGVRLQVPEPDPPAATFETVADQLVSADHLLYWLFR